MRLARRAVRHLGIDVVRYVPSLQCGFDVLSPGYHCSGKDLVNGRGVYCLTVGGVQIDEAVATAFLAALTPAAVEAALAAAQQLEADDDAALAQWRLAAERTRHEANAPSVIWETTHAVLDLDQRGKVVR